MEEITLIILAAGQGTRLRPETDHKPKCMVKVNGIPMIQHQIAIAKACGIKKIVVVKGYCGNKIILEDVLFVENKKFESTNMVRTLFCAENFITSPVIISYGDIIYNPNVLHSLIKSDSEISVVVDNDWKKYWELRFENVLEDAETLKINKQGYIKEIGQKPSSVSEIEGQYIGMIKIQNGGVEALRSLYSKEQEEYKNGNSFASSLRNLDELYMTDILQALINQGKNIKPVWVDGGWLEVDDLSDLEIARNLTILKDKILYIDRRSIN